MSIGLLGQKVGMTQIFTPEGVVIPVTVVQAGPCTVLQLKSVKTDEYDAVQLGFRDKPRRKRSEQGHVAKIDGKRAKRLQAAGAEPRPKANCEPQRYIREFRVSPEGFQIGQKLTVEVFAQIKSVDVIGTSKGRGTMGVMRRHNFHGQRATHGVKQVHRHGGSVGCNTFPARVFKGKKMAGRWGAERATARNLQVVKVDTEKNLLVIRGAIPGPNGGFVVIRPTNLLK